MYDCLIAGGGVIGLSLAYELSRHGLRVRVIDRGHLGKEASWAGAGILPPANSQTAVHPYQQLCALSHSLHASWAENLRVESGVDTGYRACGGIYLARSKGEAASLYGLKGMLEEEQVGIEQLSLDDLARLEPALSPLSKSGQIKAALLLPEEAQLRNPDHLQALLISCARRGVEVNEETELIRLESKDGCFEHAITSTGNLTARHCCICSGAWTHQLLKQLGIHNGIMPIRGQMVLFKCDQPPLRHVINEGSRYLVPRDDGHVLVGSTEEEVGFDRRTTEQAINELATMAGQLVEELQPHRIKRTWAGLRPGSFDGFPYLGRVPGYSNVSIAAGHFRSGLHLSTGTAVVMSQLIREQRPQIDLSPFRVGRG